MAVDSEFENFVRELFEPLPDITFRNMFGGLGVFRNGLMFALCSSQNVLALKADVHTIPDFQKEGCREWQPRMEGRKPVSMGYWEVPERLMDDPADFEQWAEEAFSAAARLDAGKPASQRKLKR